MIPSAAILRANIERRLRELPDPAWCLFEQAGLRPAKYAYWNGPVKSVRLTTLDDIALALLTAPWLLLTQGVVLDYFGEQCFDSTDVFLRRVDLTALDRKTRWDIMSGRRQTFTLRKLDTIAAAMGTTVALLITP